MSAPVVDKAQRTLARVSKSIVPQAGESKVTQDAATNNLPEAV
jgi:hypothetical protein